MSEKTKLFRSLLLEPLECRSVFSADGLEVWPASQSSRSFDFDRFQPARYQHLDTASTDHRLDSPSNRDLEHASDFDRVKYSGRRSSHASYGFASLMHRSRFNDAPMPPADGEGPAGDARATALDSKPSFQSRPTLDSKSAQLPAPSFETRIVVVVNPTSGGLILTRNNGPANPPLHTQFDSRDSERVESLPNSSSTTSNSTNSNSTNSNSTSSSSIGTASLAQVPTTPSPIPTLSSQSQISAAFNSYAPVSGTTGQVNIASSQALSSITSGLSSDTATFDLASQVSSSERSDGLSNHWGDEFRFTRPIPVPKEAITDQALVEQASGLDWLETLLPGLAENHRRNRMQNGFDATQPSSSVDQSWRPEASASLEVTFADGGMIALALNRDIAMSDLEELSDDARSENKAWIANVGVFRAFENGAVAVTEYAGLTNRVTRNAASSASSQASSEVEDEVANLQSHPFWASTSAALGVVMLGLRRMRRKKVPHSEKPTY